MRSLKTEGAAIRAESMLGIDHGLAKAFYHQVGVKYRSLHLRQSRAMTHEP